MKKIFLFAFSLIILSSSHCYSQEFPIFQMRNKIFQESKEIITLIDKSNNPILISSMWDTCSIAVTQIDAYFSMLGIFNSIKKEHQSRRAADYLIDWLNEVKRTNQLNIKSLNTVSGPTDALARVRMQRLKDLFLSLNRIVDDELKKLSLIRRSLKRN